MVAHQRRLLATGNPVLVVALDELGKAEVGFLLLHAQHFAHVAPDFGQLELPEHKALVDFYPVVGRHRVVDAHAEFAKLLSVVELSHLVGDFLLVDVALQGQQNLVGIDGLDEVVGNVGADGLVHDVFFFTLGDHHDGYGRQKRLDFSQRLQARESGHVLVEQNQVEALLLTQVDGVGTVGCLANLVTFAFQKKDLGAHHSDFVVYPQKSAVTHNPFLLSNVMLLMYWGVVSTIRRRLRRRGSRSLLPPFSPSRARPGIHPR